MSEVRCVKSYHYLNLSVAEADQAGFGGTKKAGMSLTFENGWPTWASDRQL